MYCLICPGLFGLLMPVSSRASAKSSSLYSSSNRAALFTNTWSIITPRSLMCWSAVYKSSSNSGTSNLLTFFKIACSTSTSRILYALNVSHFSGASLGLCRIILVTPCLVCLFGTLKYLIRALPSVIFLSSSLSTSPHCANESGKPIRAALTIVHRHCLGSNRPLIPKYTPIQIRSKAAL